MRYQRAVRIIVGRLFFRPLYEHICAFSDSANRKETDFYEHQNQLWKERRRAAIAREKTGGIYFKVSDKERKLIEQKMETAGIRNMSAYIRKMCIDGYVVRLDIPELAECAKYLHRTSANINQIARRVNSGSGYYPGELEEISTGISKGNKLLGSIFEQLSKLK